MVRRAVVVTADLETGSTWIAWLRAAGYVAVGCVGPELTHACPRTREAPCHNRDEAEVLVVDPACDPRRLCVGSVPGRAVVVDRNDEAATDRRRFLDRLFEAGAARTEVHLERSLRIGPWDREAQDDVGRRQLVTSSRRRS